MNSKSIARGLLEEMRNDKRAFWKEDFLDFLYVQLIIGKPVPKMNTYSTETIEISLSKLIDEVYNCLNEVVIDEMFETYRDLMYIQSKCAMTVDYFEELYRILEEHWDMLHLFDAVYDLLKHIIRVQPWGTNENDVIRGLIIATINM